nr:replication protein A 70 kDa DNA-binding subunit B-like [Ipomoea batatas]
MGFVFRLLFPYEFVRLYEICYCRYHWQSGRDIQRNIGGRMVRLIDFVLGDASENQLHCTVWDAHMDQLLPHFNTTLKKNKY